MNIDQLITATSLAAGARTAFWHTRSDFISARSRRHRCSTWNSRRDRRARRKERPVDAPRLGTRHAIQQDGLRDTQLHLQGAARRRLCSACSRAMHRGRGKLPKRPDNWLIARVRARWSRHVPREASRLRWTNSAAS
jgi:hypothetical protein